MAEQVAQQLDEKCKVLETLSNCQQEVGTLCALLEKDAESYSSCDQNQTSLSMTVMTVMNMMINYSDVFHCVSCAAR